MAGGCRGPHPHRSSADGQLSPSFCSPQLLSFSPSLSVILFQSQSLVLLDSQSLSGNSKNCLVSQFCQSPARPKPSPYSKRHPEPVRSDYHLKVSPFVFALCTVPISSVVPSKSLLCSLDVIAPCQSPLPIFPLYPASSPTVRSFNLFFPPRCLTPFLSLLPVTDSSFSV